MLLINFLVDVFILGGSRFGLRLLKEHLIGNNNNNITTRVLVVGAGDAAEILIREINKHTELGRYIVGLVDDDPKKRNLQIHGKEVLGNRYDIPEILEQYRVDEVVIAIPSARGKEIKGIYIYELCAKDGVKVNIVPGMNDDEDNISTEHSRISITHLGEIDIVKLDRAMEKLKRIVRNGDTAGIIKLLVDLVGTYKPNRDNILSLFLIERC